MALPELFANTPTPGSASPITSLSGNSGSISNSATTINTAAAAPTALQGSGQFRILVDQEIMLVTGGASTTTWTVVRGNNLPSPDTTTNVVHLDGAPVYHVITAGALANAGVGTFVPISQKGVASGVPTLGTDSQVPASQLGHAGFANQNVVSKVYNATAFGVLANGNCVTDASISAASHQLSSPSAGFTSADANKLVSVLGAGTPATGLTLNSIPAGVAGPTWTAASGGWTSLGASFQASGGAISHVQDVIGSNLTFSSASAGGTITLTITPTAGHGLLLEFVAFNETGPPTFTVTDSHGGTWSLVSSSVATITNNSITQLWECLSAPSSLSTTITVTIASGTVSVSSQAASAWVGEFANLGAPDNVPTPTVGSGTTVTPPNVSYASGELVVLTGFTAGVISASPSAPYAVVNPLWFNKAENQSAWQITSSAGNSNGQITSIALTAAGLSGAVPSGAVTLSNGTNTQTFATTGAAQGATSLPVVAQVPAFTFAAGSTVSTIKPPLQTTIASVSGGVATLAAPAGTTVASAVCFYASDDTAAAQAAINAAQAVGGTVEFPEGFIGLSAALVSNNAIKIRGQSCKGVYGGFAQSAEAYNWPGVAPYLVGTVFWPFTPATDCLQLTSVGKAQDLKDFGILFPGAHYNTGHGINVVPSGTYNGHPDQGCTDCDWDHVYVWGHDGSHYAFNVQNVLYPRFAKLRSWGGGGMHFWQNSSKGFNGNLTAIDCFAFVFNCGLAHGLYIDDQSTPLGGGAFDFSVFVRWQCWVSSDAQGTLTGVLGPYKPTSQALLAVNGQLWSGNSGQNGFVFIAPDFETSANAPMANVPGLSVASIAQGIPFNWY